MDSQRDLVFTPTDFEHVRRLIHARAGIALAAHKTDMVYSRLARRLRALGHARFDEYLALLQADGKNAEWEFFTNALTTNLTAFFREAHHFPILVDHVRSCDGPARVWTCAASTGEEAYSIAMALAEVASAQSPAATVLATDIDTRAIETAARGIYTLADVDKLAPARLRRFFLRGAGKREGMVRVHPKLRAMVAFRALNLLAPELDVEGPFDAIFCRNLLIYFDKPTQARLLDRLARLLRPDGLLFAGHSENLAGVSPAFQLRSHTVYSRVVERSPRLALPA